MSTDPSILLRMLEPAVRPDGGKVAGASGRPAPGGTPFEQTPFEQLLNDARRPADPARMSGGNAASAGGNDSPGVEKKQADPLAKLVDVDRIENAALRQALGRARAAMDQDGDQ